MCGRRNQTIINLSDPAQRNLEPFWFFLRKIVTWWTWWTPHGVSGANLGFPVVLDFTACCEELTASHDFRHINIFLNKTHSQIRNLVVSGFSVVSTMLMQNADCAWSELLVKLDKVDSGPLAEPWSKHTTMDLFKIAEPPRLNVSTDAFAHNSDHKTWWRSSSLMNHHARIQPQNSLTDTLKGHFYSEVREVTRSDCHIFKIFGPIVQKRGFVQMLEMRKLPNRPLHWVKIFWRHSVHFKTSRCLQSVFSKSPIHIYRYIFIVQNISIYSIYYIFTFQYLQ